MDAGASPILSRRAGSEPIVAIALGSGGARGFAHIAVLEALDELGVTPAAIAGTSIGAMIGAAYAAGMRGRDIRAYALGAVRSRGEMMGKLLRARVGRFSELTKPLLVVATDFYDRRELVMSSGALGPAVAGSMAIPGLIRPVVYEGRYLIDGGAVNPLPYDLLFDHADVVVAVDVTFGGRRREPRRPAPFESMFGAAQIMQGAITAQKLKMRSPDILVRPGVEQFGVLDFLRASQILRAAEPAKDELKRRLSARFEAALRD
jgi:NTE family protein